MEAERGKISIEQINRLLRAHDLQQIIDLARPLLGHPLILSNGSYTVMAISKDEDIEDPRWQEIRSSGGVPLGVATDSGIYECYRRSLETGRPAVDVNDQGVYMLRKALAGGGRVLGYLDAPIYADHVEEEELELFDLLCSVLTAELQRDPDRANPPDSMMDYFVYDLLEGNITDPERIQERFDYFHWDLFDKGKVQIITIRGSKRELVPENMLFRRLMDEISAAFAGLRVFIYVNQIKLLYPVRQDQRDDGALLKRLEALLEEEDLVAGISRPLISIQTIADFNRQAERAAELGRRFHPDRRIHFYDSYAIYYALELAERRESMMQFCHSAIILLRDYDLAHETDLLESLRVYLTHNRSIGESAAALYIHRNTMNYRIARINELTGVDLSDSDVFCHLLFSFYALDYREKQPKERRDGPALHPYRYLDQESD